MPAPKWEHSEIVDNPAIFERQTIVEQDGYIHSAPQLVVWPK